MHDAGAGLLAGLGARSSGADLTAGVAGLTGLSAVDLGAVRDLLGDVELVGVVPTAERDAQLLGLRGITSRRGRAAGEDPAPLLAADSALQRLTELVAPGHATAPGAGACGGLGWAVLALGGRLVTGPELGLADVAAEVRSGGLRLRRLRLRHPWWGSGGRRRRGRRRGTSRPA